MREIKFRAWDKVLNKMITQENVDKLLDKTNPEEWETEIPYSSDEWYPAYQILGIFNYFNDIQKLGIKRYEPSENRFEIMQYTGLKDKNGKEIYEGDIVKTILYKYKIIFKNCCFKAHCIKNNLEYTLEWLQQATENANVGLEVIGNIYDNPELLED